MEILFATGNPTKAKRFSKGLAKNDIIVKSLKDIELKLDIEENGNSPIENALIKARACYDKTHMITIGMDDSLYLENVPEELQPGLMVRRFNGKELNDEELLERFINLVKEYGVDHRLNGKWIYGLALIDNNGNEYTYTWERKDFYMTDIIGTEIQPGYPLNAISKYIKIDKYFKEVTDEDRKLLNVDESDVVDFIVSKINKE